MVLEFVESDSQVTFIENTVVEKPRLLVIDTNCSYNSMLFQSLKQQQFVLSLLVYMFCQITIYYHFPGQ